MADAVTKIVLVDDRQLYGIHITSVSDGTGESAVVKADKSAIGVASNGIEAAALDLISARWTIVGLTWVKLLWDHGTDDTCMILAGVGAENFAQGVGARQRIYPLADPHTDGTGDVILTTLGHDSGDTYDITLWFQKRATTG